jgi:transcriptional regulator with XRE-family HTH domain
MLSQVTDRRTATTDALARRRLELVAAEYVVRMGRRIAQAREEAGMSQNDLARELPGKVGAQMVSKWERGLHEPRSDTLEAIAGVLKRPVAYFMADEPQEGTPDLLRALNGSSQPQLDRIEEKLDRLLAVVEPVRLLPERVRTMEEVVAEFGELLTERLPAAAPERRQSAGK